MTDELIITSAVVVEPGDKILLVVPAQIRMDDLQELKHRLEDWAPGADWLLISGIETVHQRKEVRP